ncbi:MAG: TIGR00341 family protein [Candidatus Wukongarchaeota archaeon]|nr:TIGR00341 family protein [Candidatus Wukongarchaeota archaeon]
MKKVIVTARKEDLKKIEPVLENILYVMEKEGPLIKINIYIPDEGLDDLINKFQEVLDFRLKETMIEVFTPDFVISSVLKRAEKKAEKEREKTPVEKLIDSIRPQRSLDIGKIALTSIAGIIALTGLFLNNVAIIIGAMLLSPLLGPIYAFAINTALGRGKDAFKSIGNLSIMILIVIVISYLATLFIDPFIELRKTSEIRSRIDTGLIYVIMAILLGFASIFALSKGISEVIAGVAIAAALLPPAVVVGIAFALYPQDAIDAIILTLENVLGLMAGSLSAVIILGIGPRKYYEKTVARKFIVRTTLFIIILLVLLFAVILRL